MSAPVRDGARGCEIDVLVAPRAARSQLVGLHDERLKVQLAAPPVDGAANAALVELLAGVLEVPRAAVEIARGATGRRKTVRVAGLAAAAARARLGLGAALLAGLCACESEIPFPVRVILPEETAELRRADNATIVLSPQGLTATYEVDGTDFSLELAIEPDDVQRTLTIYLADRTELLAWGRTAPFILDAPPADLAVMLARPGALSTWPGAAPEPDPDLLAAPVRGLGLLLLSAGGDTALLNEFTYAIEVGAPLDPEDGEIPDPADGALVGDLGGGVSRVTWSAGLRVYRFSPADNAWSEPAVIGDATPPRPGAAWVLDRAREHLLLVGGGDETTIAELSLLPDDDGQLRLRTLDLGLDGPRQGARAVLVDRGDVEAEPEILVFGGAGDLPAVYAPKGAHALGPVGAWSGAGCAQVDLADAASVRVLCLGGLRGGAATADAVLVDVPAKGDPVAEERAGFLSVPLADPRLFTDDLAIYAQAAGMWVRVDREDLAVTTAETSATRAAGGHSITLATGVTFLVGGRTADDGAVDRWWVFAPALDSP